MPAKFNANNVLIVDDDPDILYTVKSAFTDSGAQVTTANDGNKAVEMFNRIKPELVILDMMMPKQSGYLVIEKIKPHGDPTKKPFIIMITANEGKRHELYARHLGVNDYINKPFSVEKLLEVSCRLLGGEYIEPEGL